MASSSMASSPSPSNKKPKTSNTSNEDAKVVLFWDLNKAKVKNIKDLPNLIVNINSRLSELNKKDEGHLNYFLSEDKRDRIAAGDLDSLDPTVKKWLEYHKFKLIHALERDPHCGPPTCPYYKPREPFPPFALGVEMLDFIFRTRDPPRRRNVFLIANDPMFYHTISMLANGGVSTKARATKKGCTVFFACSRDANKSLLTHSQAHERKLENLRAFIVNLANSRGLLLPETRLFEQKFLDLCLSRTRDHPTYSAMIFIAITELNEEGGSSEEAISEFIKSKYKSLPFAHTSLLSHHLAKLVEKREILCDYNNYCYTLPGENKTAASIDAERHSVEITLRANDQCTANEAMNLQNEEGSAKTLKTRNRNVDLLEERNLTESRTSPKRKACGDGAKACLSDLTVKTRSKEGVAIEPEVALEKSGSEGRIEANSEGGELHEVAVLDERNYVLMEESSKGEENLRETNSKRRKAKLQRTSNTTKEACVEVKSIAYKTHHECQTEACSNIIALKKKLKQCREKDQQMKTGSEVDDVSRLPLSMESCEELRKKACSLRSSVPLMKPWFHVMKIEDVKPKV